MIFLSTLRSRFIQHNIRKLSKLGAIAVGASGIAIGVQLTGGFQLLEWTVLDQWFRLRPLEARKIPIVFVTISESDLFQLQRFPISDQSLATAIEAIKRERPIAIGLDLYRNLPVEPGHEKLLQTFASTPNLIGVAKAVGDTNADAVEPPPILRDREQVGNSDIVLDADGKVRRSLLSIQRNGKTRLALGTKLAIAYLKTVGIQTQRSTSGEVRLGKAAYRSIQPSDGGYIRADVGGYQILSNYLRPQESIPKLSISDVLTGRIPPGLIRDRLVIIGSTAESVSGDRFYVPYSMEQKQTWFGVEVHANLAAQLITSAIDGRATLSGVPEKLEWAWILVWSGVGTALGWLFQYRRMGVLIPVAIAFLCASSYGLFLLGWWMVLISPLIAFITAGSISRAYWVWQTLTNINQALELKVSERTQELREKNIALEQAKLAADTANQAKSMFLASMNHELRTPLTAILGFSELLKRAPQLDPEDRENIEIINRSGLHLLDLINDVLELAKIEAGAIAIELKTVHLPTLLKTAETVIQGTAIAKNLRFQIDCATDLPTVIRTDERKLRQILINLLSNAVKFTSQGSITLRVTAIDNWLNFCVIDSGSGIASDELDRLFQPFFQAEAGRNLQKGTGLGLSITQRFVQLMEGEISVHSTPGQGSTFTVKLPLETIVEPTELNLSPEVSWKLAPNQPKIHVLIVDDNAEICRFLVQLLSRVGFEARSTTTGKAAIAQWQSWQPELMLIDLQLPDIDGTTIAQQIRTVRQSIEINQLERHSNQDTILIALSANIFQTEHSAIFAAGFDDVIWKPFREATLLNKIGQQLEIYYQ